MDYGKRRYVRRNGAHEKREGPEPARSAREPSGREKALLQRYHEIFEMRKSLPKVDHSNWTAKQMVEYARSIAKDTTELALLNASLYMKMLFNGCLKKAFPDEKRNVLEEAKHDAGQ